MTAANSESEKKRRLRLDMVVADKEFFLQQSSSGFVGGPKSRDGIGRHITVAVDPDTETVKHVHMKSGSKGNLREDWRLRPESITSDVNAWIRENSIPLDPDEVREIDRSSYVVSGRRVLISFDVLQAVGSKIFWILFRGFRFIPFQINKHEGVTRIAFVVDPQQLAKRIRRFRPLLMPLKAILPKVLPRLLIKAARRHLVKMKDMTDGDVSVVFSRVGAEPTVVVKQKEFFSIKLEKVVQTAMDLYSRFKIAELKPDFDASEKPARIEMIVRGSE